MNFNPMQMNFNPMQMNFNPMQNQMKNNNYPNYNNEEVDNEKETMCIFDKNNIDNFEIFLSGINDKRKTINFIDTKNNRITKIFPIYFTKSELYSYIKCLNHLETILFYRNDILDNNESSIQDIGDNNTITLFFKPTKNYRNSSLYKYIDNLFPNTLKSNVSVTSPTGTHYNYVLPNKIKISLMIKFISLVLDLNSDFIFVFNGEKMNELDGRKIHELFDSENLPITIIAPHNLRADTTFGKWIKVTMFHLKKKVFIKGKVCKYWPIKDLYQSLSKDEFKNMHIFFNGKKLDKNDNNSIASLGINEDFECIIE